MAEKKITKRDRFNQLLEIESVKQNEDLVAFIKHEIELLEKKAGSKSGATKTQKENEEIKVQLLQALAEVGRPVTVSEFQKESGYASQFSNQKLSALLKLMKDNDGTVEKAVVKGKSYFSVVG